MNVFLAWFVVCTPLVYAADIATSEGGQTIELNADGTWRAVEEQRFAITQDGQRVELFSDGHWSVAESKPPSVADATSLVLTGVEILKQEKSRGKNKHVQIRTVFSIQVTNTGTPPLALQTDRKQLANSIFARSSNGGSLPVIDVAGCTDSLLTNDQCLLTVTAKGSPAWFGNKSVELQILPNALGNPDTRTLSTPYSQVKHRRVNRFDA